MNNSHDPLAVLRGGDQPITPDPAFAARLRARLESALSLPANTSGVVMSGTDTAITELNSTGTAAPRPAAIPYLSVPDARTAIDWYIDALGASLVGAPILMDDGRVGHAELSVGGGILYLADEYPELGLKAPAPQSVSVSLMLAVDDTDAALRRARDRGATVLQEAHESHGSRGATILDPSGHRWMLSGPITGAPLLIQHGDIGYVSINTPDAARAKRFYAQVLGWSFEGHHVVPPSESALSMGIFETPGLSTLFCCYAVDDLDAAREAILTGGGTVGEPQRREFGTVLDATDPQGSPFAVYRDTAGTPRPPLNGAGPGELSYITYLVEDSAAFRAFYSRVLYWTFEPGRVQDGWAVQGSQPMAGMAGGSAQPSTVPMWTVEDIDAAVARVRAAGGVIVEEPSTQPYGKSALCADDQGGRFYLGQH
ncbi:VOC family protein [Mycolicibacterium diernhoferi]|uniref:Glyoxalase n=1 Tax=Mycolicibacterium diernhoferi TaxID=1801 RepID=A0A1Q4HET7_9MYCO|nr:VOC family protein [Mycolicibacterium diernhoferi]OJZ65932.1 glyoxalase [Mycolicibacterium diernhoferi]OPE54008.1 glyoxalase [Mycolicibacterium diernhoferi]PEG53305.1 glyoxalase [Mycolicibacterium diernhoferi]QYL23840.1 VOC family protein [Mycolicibacterium diernhoferi]